MRRGGRGVGEEVGGGPLEVGSLEILQGDTDFHSLFNLLHYILVRLSSHISPLPLLEYSQPVLNHSYLETGGEAGPLCAGSPCASAGQPEQRIHVKEEFLKKLKKFCLTFLWKARPQRSQENGL